MDLQHWVNDGLMVFFFFLIGMEVRRELSMGELVQRSRLTVPALAAVAGLVLPALIYLAINAGGDGAVGWGIPMATDTAFVLGALALFGRHTPIQLRVFLLSLSVVDDIGALSAIAIFYSDEIDLVALAIAGAVRPRVHRAVPPAGVARAGLLRRRRRHVGGDVRVGRARHHRRRRARPAGQRLPAAPGRGGAGRVAGPGLPPVAGARPGPRGEAVGGARHLPERADRRRPGPVEQLRRRARCSPWPTPACASTARCSSGRSPRRSPSASSSAWRSASWSASGWPRRSPSGCGSASSRPGVGLGSVWSGAALDRPGLHRLAVRHRPRVRRRARCGRRRPSASWPPPSSPRCSARCSSALLGRRQRRPRAAGRAGPAGRPGRRPRPRAGRRPADPGRVRRHGVPVLRAGDGRGRASCAPASATTCATSSGTCRWWSCTRTPSSPPRPPRRPAPRAKFWEMHDKLFAHQDDLEAPRPPRLRRRPGAGPRAVRPGAGRRHHAQRIRDDVAGGGGQRRRGHADVLRQRRPARRAGPGPTSWRRPCCAPTRAARPWSARWPGPRRRAGSRPPSPLSPPARLPAVEGLEETADPSGASPRLDDRQLAVLRRAGRRRTTTTGEVLVQGGASDWDFVVVLEGTVAVVEDPEPRRRRASRAWSWSSDPAGSSAGSTCWPVSAPSGRSSRPRRARWSR